MSGPGAIPSVGQQPILTLILQGPLAEKANKQKVANTTKSLILVLRDPPVVTKAPELSSRVTIVLHDPVVEQTQLKKAISLAQDVLYMINKQLISHRPQEGCISGDRKITVIHSASVNSNSTQYDIAAIQVLHQTVEKIESIVLQHTAGFEDALQQELQSFRTSATDLKGCCRVLLEKQQNVSAAQAQAAKVRGVICGVKF